MKLTTFHYKTLSETLLIIPGLLLLMLGIGEISSGDMSGIQHFFQLIPLILFAITCWYYPKNGGSLLMVVAIILGLSYLFLFKNLPLATIILTDLILFGLPLLSGALFTYSSKFTR